MLEGHSSKKELILGSTEIDTINNSDIYDTYKDLYLSKKECEERLLLGTQEADGTALTLTTQENAILLGFDFLKHTAYPYDLKERMFIRI